MESQGYISRFKWDDSDNALDEIFGMMNDEGKFEILARKMADLPHLSLDTEEAKILVKVYRQSEFNNSYGHTSEVTMTELASEAAVDKTHVNLRPPYTDEFLGHLSFLRLLSYRKSRNDVFINLTRLGKTVGMILFEKRTQGIY